MGSPLTPLVLFKKESPHFVKHKAKVSQEKKEHLVLIRNYKSCKATKDIVVTRSRKLAYEVIICSNPLKFGLIIDSSIY